LADAPAEAVAPEASAPEPVLEAVATPDAQVDPALAAAESEPEKPTAPKKRGWWSRG
jgi:ribonuclease E